MTAQDLHFSQYYNAPANLSPAVAGQFDGDLRFGALYRSQWDAVPVPYHTFSAAFDSRYFPAKNQKNSFAGYGIFFNNDQAGDSQLQLNQLGLNLAWHQRLDVRFYAAAGVQLMAAQRAVQPQKLTFESQWNGDLYDPQRPTGEAAAGLQHIFGSISAGIQAGMGPVAGSLSSVQAGVAVFHLNRPVGGFYAQQPAHLPRKMQWFLQWQRQVRPLLTVKAGGLYAVQGAYRQCMINAAVRYRLKKLKGAEKWIQAGAGYRMADAVIPTVEMGSGPWTTGVSFDINTSRFKAATQKKGGPEFFFQYIITKPHPPEEFKACPVF